ncbi:unnamed protein product [Paramecium sonneborni]|uniref:Uncharacterized protein n=1 Tax=Paramecium sonneborni TaxID=65129 RepID=A0A8S1RNT7_9CILI|nr:unnamed protein product [Paramecium sonneborni]
MSKEQNKVISCGYDSLLLVIEYQQHSSIFVFKQKIYVDQWDYRVCFINNHVFTFQPSFQIYTFDQQTQQYIKYYNIPVKSGGQLCSSLFPSIFNHIKILSLSKMDVTQIQLNLFKSKMNKEVNHTFFQLEQSINCKVDHYYYQCFKNKLLIKQITFN